MTTIWRETPSAPTWRVQVEDLEAVKRLHKAPGFRRVAVCVAGGRFEVFAFRARDRNEAERLIAEAIGQDAETA